MSEPKPLTRKELAEFLPSQRAIRAFEKSFEIIPQSIDDSVLLSSSATPQINAIIGLLSEISEKLDLLVIQDNQILDDIFNNRQEPIIEDIIQSKNEESNQDVFENRNELGTLSPQNADNVEITG